MSLLPLIVPLILLLVALDLGLRAVPRAHSRLRLPEIAALFAVATSVGSAILLALQGPSTSPVLGIAGIGLSARTDIVSVAMILTVSFVGWIVLRFSRTALDGEARQGRFMSVLTATLAYVLLLVSAGNLVQLALAWVAVGVGLHRLLLFYPDRPRAQRAARKKTVSGIIGSGALLGAAGLMIAGFGTADIATIAEMARMGDVPGTVWIVAILLAVAAVFKSALIPTHGWLTEVMEAPTPVSALLHAGVVNAGGFLLIRFADVLLAAPGVLALLALIGGFSALVGAAVALTQPAVKTALAWSTCAQMGFMVLQCGLALFPLALLHIVAHSLYKAHAFLSSGGAVEQVAAIRRPGPVAVPDLRAVGRAFAIAIGIYVLVGAGFGFWDKPPQMVALGAILIFGVAYLIAQGLADLAPWPLTWRTAAMSGAATLAYFTLQTGAVALSADTLPNPPQPDGLIWAAIVLAVSSFALAAVAQATFPLWAGHPAAAGLRVHLMNGLYFNALTDRLTGHWRATKG
ncbi:proton-conducting transporter membrane subunit [Lutimaribacter saemankumensis]|uniref:Probable inorganic carbon transporter subunit DabB n=1 Tax=Lutimaribacter saemankumensis TaxID=490829 RepID=A0A1G8RAY2_9RHOB|nr:proton-conducting transporter membrane subunit [Lutimaribacter saemankumensis]SDJ14172.1 NADH-quinone oxidoreductase subunit L/NAD(P)H-quinone oxidoreductase subunit 5 [Lutimaribacter saemankumensis]